MEQEKSSEERVREKIRKIYENTLKSRSPKEHIINHRMVGSEASDLNVIYLFQPHNYRLYFDFSRENFNPKKPSNHALQKFKSMVGMFNPAYNYTALNYDSEHKYEKFLFCTIRVKKNQVEVINHSHDKQWRKITSSNIDEVDERINQVMNDLKEHSIKTLKYFIELHGGKSTFTILNERCEQGLHGDDFLDKIPSELIINDTYIKKVYKAKTEFKSTAALKNYVSNRSIEKIAPDIALELNKLHLKAETLASVDSISQINSNLMQITASLTEFSKAQELFAENIKSHLELINEYRHEVKDMKKPFFIRWYEYFRNNGKKTV